MRFAELKTKEIVRVSDGKKLGFAEDLIIDEVTNKVVALRVPRPTRGFKKPEYFEISFDKITKIGENVILVNSDENINLEVQESGGYYFSPRMFKRAEKNKKQLN